MSKISFIIPAWNEERTLENLVNKVLEVKLPKDIESEIIITNDGSKDNTWGIMQEIASEHKEVKIFSNEKNLGKTQTVRNGILHSSGDYVIIQDADLEYDPNEIVDLLNLMIEKNLDVVYGDRFGKKNKVVYWQNYLGNKFLSLVSNLFTYPRIRIWIPDMEVCYKLMKGDIARDISKDITIKSMFGLEPVITARLTKYKINGKHLKFGIVPISYYPRTIAEGKHMHAIKHGVEAIKEIIIYNL